MKKVFEKLINRHQFKNLLKKVRSIHKEDFTNQKSLGSMSFVEFRKTLFGNNK